MTSASPLAARSLDASVGTPALRCGRFLVSLTRPRIMAILNVTPDSFSDGGRFTGASAAVDEAHRLIERGADIIDIGGESTRPGAPPVSIAEELDRVLPVIEALRDVEVPISIDTFKPEVMRAALAAGAGMINDIFALTKPGALEVAAQSDCAVCLMHMQGTPQTMQIEPRYDDVVVEVRDFLAARIAAAARAGVARNRIVVDPGFGFGKKSVHNLELLRNVGVLAELGVPVLVGLSRKAMLGKITGKPVTDRVSESVAAALIAVERGAQIVRVHDVGETRDALAVLTAVEHFRE